MKQQIQKQHLEKYITLKKPLEERVIECIKQVEEGKVISFKMFQDKYDNRYENK